jgi:2-polyprenyl-3-methyl-5-hydroxy-6-metoxy-1,4-benzoquinol methylase
MLKDTSYGLVRRLFFVEQAIGELQRKLGKSHLAVADIGCGTGELLTIPLAKKLGGKVTIYAFEPEAITFQSLLNRIQSYTLKNIHAIKTIEALQELNYDAIIISEVIEHVDNPVSFLEDLKQVLQDRGILIITTPNGFGFYELEMLIFNTLELLGVISILRQIKRRLIGKNDHSDRSLFTDTLAISPHVNFFSLGDLYYILSSAGLKLIKMEGKHLFAGPVADRIINKSEWLISLNSYLGNKLPLQLVSGWMLIASKSSDEPKTNKAHHVIDPLHPIKKIYADYKRWTNIYLAKKEKGK